MDIRTQGSKGAGDRKAPSDPSKDQPNDASKVRDELRTAEITESVSVPSAPEVEAYFDGQRVTDLKVLLRHAAFLITEQYGTHEATRFYVANGLCRCGERGNGRVGPGTVTKVEFDRVKGLTVSTTHGIMWSPPSDCQVTIGTT